MEQTLHIPILLHFFLFFFLGTYQRFLTSTSSDTLWSGSMTCITVLGRYLQLVAHDPTILTALILPILLLPLVVRKMSTGASATNEEEPYSLEYFKTLYRQRRDAFRKNDAANEELRQWKARNDGFKYVEM